MKKDLLPLALRGLGIGTTEFLMMGILPDIAKDFQISIPVAGHLILAYALGVVIGAPLLVPQALAIVRLHWLVPAWLSAVSYLPGCSLRSDG